jgi:hypothetical protein
MWTSILSTVKSGDIVVFQLGHYDSLQPGSAQDPLKVALDPSQAQATTA